MFDFEGFGLDSEVQQKALEDHDFIVADGADKNAKADRRAEKLRKEFAKLILGHDRNIQMEKVSNKSRRETQAQKDMRLLNNAKKDVKMLPLLTDPVSQLATCSTNRFVDQRILTNEKPLTNLDCLNVNATDNGCLSFLDSLLNANTANETGENLIKD